MNADGAMAGVHVHQAKVYLLAILVYLGIASLIVVPIAHKNNTEHAVKAQLSQYLKQTKSEQPAVAAAPISGAPASIAIDRLDINLPVAPGHYNINTEKWTLDSRHVFTDNYTEPNPMVSTNQQRTTVLYGHDIPGVLVKTSQLAYGDIMTVSTQNGYQFRYYYDKSKVLAPTDASVLNEKNTGDSVVLITCTGAWYQNRHAMYFHLLDVKKIATNTSATNGVTS